MLNQDFGGKLVNFKSEKLFGLLKPLSLEICFGFQKHCRMPILYTYNQTVKFHFAPYFTYKCPVSVNMNRLAVFAAISAMIVIMFYLGDHYLVQNNQNFLMGIHDGGGVISEAEFLIILEETVRTFVSKLGSPKLRTFYHYERHRDSYEKLFKRTVEERHRKILDHIQEQCQESNKPQYMAKCETSHYLVKDRQLLTNLCLVNPPLLLQHPLAHIYVLYQYEIKSDMQITPGEAIKQIIINHRNQSKPAFNSIFNSCHLCDKKFGGVVTAENAHEDLTYLVSKCKDKPDIRLIAQELGRTSDEEKNFWLEVTREDIEELLTLPAVQDALSVAAVDGAGYFRKMGIALR
jgi:hypothetical protein